jgi:hypothetical protein
MNDLTPEQLAYADWIATNLEEFERKAAELEITVDYYIAEFV